MSTRSGKRVAPGAVVVSLLALCVGLLLYFDVTPAVTPFVVAPVGSDVLENVIVPTSTT